MLKVITTVGTSILANCDRENGNINWSYINRPFKDKNMRRSDREKEKVKEWIATHTDKTQISAEIKSLFKLREEKNNEKLEVYLLATDTIASALASEIVKEILENEDLKVYYNPDFDVIKDLQVEDFNRFEKGKNKLIERISKLIDEFVKNEKSNKKRKFIKENVLFNITGGYKGIIPILTILAQLYECEIFYIFEESNDPITIPRIPINFDPFLLESLYVDIYLKKKNHSHQFRNEKKLKEFGFINRSNEITALGELFYKMAYTYNPLSSNVLGYFVEYKILEYLHYKNKKFEHSYNYRYTEKKNGKNKSMELDFVFKENENNWEVWEIKPMAMFLNQTNKKKIAEQFEKQLANIKELKKYKVIIYSITDTIKNELRDIVREIEKKLNKKFSHADIQFIFLHLTGMKGKEQQKQKNPYQALFKHSIKESDFENLFNKGGKDA